MTGTTTPRASRAPRARQRRRRRTLAGLVCLLLLGATGLLGIPAAYAAGYTRISGDGSSWAANAVSQWNADVATQGVTVDYSSDGSSTGRKNFAQGLSDFAVSEIPYTGDTSDPQDSVRPGFDYSLLPVVAGGTSFMYNLPVNGNRFTQLRLSQAALAGIFSGQITTWNDPAIAATNPGVNLPAQTITVVVRSDGSGATAQFTLWMLRQFPQQYAALCADDRCNASSATSYFPYQGLSNFVGQTGSLGVTNYTSSTPYTINYDEYSYAQAQNFPVAQLQNAAGYYITPTDTAVAVALTQAKINGDTSSDNYLSQDLSNVYAYGDPRTYPISAYSYLVVPAQTEGNFNTAKGATLGFYSSYALCEGQQSMGSLGYSPLPMNLVLAAMDQVLKIPGVDSATQSLIQATKSGVTSGSGNPCGNPTFKAGDDPAHNVLVDTAPFPAGCDAACQAPWKLAGAGTNGGVGGGSGGVKNAHTSTNGTKQGSSSSSSGTTDSASPSTDASGGTTADPGTGTGAGTTTGTDPATGLPPAGASTVASPVCDADTGVCSTPGATDATVTSGGAITPTSAVIPSQGTWGGTQLAIAVCLLLGLMLVVGPALVSSRLERARRPGTGGGSS